MARVNMMKTIVSDRRQPHSPLDNVNTPYNPIRLLKGAPPGQEAVNHYISELSIEKKNNTKLADKERKHLVMLEVRPFPSLFSSPLSPHFRLVTMSINITTNCSAKEPEPTEI